MLFVLGLVINQSTALALPAMGRRSKLILIVPTCIAAKPNKGGTGRNRTHDRHEG